MDTDSAYMALSGPLEDIIKPDLREEFFTSYGLWFPKPYCSDHKDLFVITKTKFGSWEPFECCKKQLLHDKRTPGLFKTEFSGDGMVALNSKTYY